MAVMYVTEQGAALTKRGEHLVVEKRGTTIHRMHAFKVSQVVLMGRIQLSPAVVPFLLGRGIDTVFLSMYGRYHGRLASQLGKNVELRLRQYNRFQEPEFAAEMARRCIRGKIENCRVLLRRRNQERRVDEVVEALHRLRALGRRLSLCPDAASVMGVEGAAGAVYFGVFDHMLQVEGMEFNGRNRRPPKDPVNVLLSFGYTLLANAVETRVNLTGLDPYLGCLHSPEYGRPSLVLDLMEEVRPVLVDALVVGLVNKKVIGTTHFHRPEDREPPAFAFAGEPPKREDYPIILDHEGARKLIAHFEARLDRRVLYPPRGKQLTYRDILLEQARSLARLLEGEGEYEPFTMR